MHLGTMHYQIMATEGFGSSGSSNRHGRHKKGARIGIKLPKAHESRIGSVLRKQNRV
jgi:hypothetical protein